MESQHCAAGEDARIDNVGKDQETRDPPSKIHGVIDYVI